MRTPDGSLEHRHREEYFAISPKGCIPSGTSQSSLPSGGLFVRLEDENP
ncbi:hypothetical protein [Paenibacillus sonchi]|nr:hypothetical protein [Paenibacillus sonchi]